MEQQEATQRKSELRVALEGALFKRARSPRRPGEQTWGFAAEKRRDGRWNGNAWFLDKRDVKQQASVGGAVTPEALGYALLGAVEAL